MKKRPNWPAYVSESNGRIVYRPRIKTPPEGYGIDSKGFLKPPIKLGKVGDSDEIILRAYMKASYALEHNEKRRKNCLFSIRDRYLSSNRYAGLMATTQKSYQELIDVFLRNEISVDGERKRLGDLMPDQITLPYMNAIKESLYTRHKGRGEQGTSYVNGQIRVLRAMLSWALNNIYDLGIEHNPVKGIELGKEPTRSRYVSDEEYLVQYDFSVDNAPPWMPLMFEFCYLLACRSVEVCSLSMDDIKEDGIVVKRTKGSKTNIIRWSERLTEVKEAALIYRGKVGTLTEYLLPSGSGNKLTKNTIQAAMSELKKKMRSAPGVEIEPWTLHDLKRKGISDASDPKIGGHKSASIMERYLTMIKRYDSVR